MSLEDQAPVTFASASATTLAYAFDMDDETMIQTITDGKESWDYFSDTGFETIQEMAAALEKEEAA